jgi:hypothetical protein
MMGWLEWFIPIIISLLQGGNENKTTQTTETPAPTPFDPGYSMLSPALMSMLAQNVNRLSGAGFPGGKGIGGDMMNDIIGQVSQAWPDIIEGYGGAATRKAGPKRSVGRGALREPVVSG